MKLKKWTALALSAALATCMLTGCPWEENEENSDNASSTPGTSQGGGHSGPDDSENTGGSTGGDSNPISVTYPYATTYNVKEQTATSPDTETVEFNQENAAAAQLSAAPRLVQALGRLSRAGDSESNCTFYTLLPSDEHDRDVTIEHENLVYTTKLTADISGASTPVKIDLSDKKTGDWQATAAYAQDMFEKLFIEENGTPKGTPEDGYYCFLLDDVNMLAEVVAAIFHKESVTLDLSKNGLIFEENVGPFTLKMHNYPDSSIIINTSSEYGPIQHELFMEEAQLMPEPEQYFINHSAIYMTHSTAKDNLYISNPLTRFVPGL